MITDQRVHDREFGNLLEIKDNFTKIVVSIPLVAEFQNSKCEDDLLYFSIITDACNPLCFFSLLFAVNINDYKIYFADFK